MIFSLHDQVNGGFKYFEAPGTVPINDDHPTPSFASETALGVPSTLAGRPVPANMRPAGKGLEAKGIIITPNARQQDSVSSSIPSGLGGFSDGVCPHWQRENVKGDCVDKWWVGPPLGWVGSGAGYALSGAALGVLAWLMFRKDR
jgi:hypothetical protein